MSVVAVALGAALILFVAWDVLLTVFHPSARGPLSYLTNRGSWVVTRAVATRLGRRSLLPAAGPLAMVANVVVWAVGLWLGYALLYLPSIEAFSYDEPASFGGKGVVEALYVSGVALTTVGFGDVVGPTDLLRLLTVLEGWSGLIAITAAITYVISVYPLVSSVRGAALRLGDLEASTPQGAARRVVRAGEREVGDVHRALVETHENLRRFPVLYYFHAPTIAESVETLLRGSILVYATVRWGLRRDGDESPGDASIALRRALLRVMDDFEEDYIGGLTTRFEGPPPLDREAARSRLRRLQAAVADADPEAAADDEDAPEEAAAFLARAEAFLSRLAGENRADSPPLLEGRAAPE